MASIAQGPQPFNRRVTDRAGVASPATTVLRADGIRVSWGGVWGGVLLAVGLLVLLTALGAAIGISATTPGETDASALGTGAAIWAGVSLLLALFVGGMLATRMGAISDRATGFCEGSLVWIVSVLLVAFFASSGVATLAGGAFRLVGGAAQVAGSAMQQQDGNASGGASGMIDQAKEKVGQAMEQAQDPAMQQKAREAKPAATKAAWITFGALVLSLFAAVIGAMVGRRNDLPELR